MLKAFPKIAQEIREVATCRVAKVEDSLAQVRQCLSNEGIQHTVTSPNKSSSLKPDADEEPMDWREMEAKVDALFKLALELQEKWGQS